MSSDPWTDESQAVVTQPTTAQPSRARVAAERIGIGLIAGISLMIPVIFGLMFYLAVNGGIMINANDPLRETRLWIVQERTGATGLGLTITSPQQIMSGTQCAITSITFLKWDRRLRLETDASYCRCYENQKGQLVETSTATCKS